MMSSTIQQFIDAINQPENFDSCKYFELELSAEGMPTVIEYEDKLVFRAYNTNRKKHVALTCYLTERWGCDFYRNKISNWHNRKKMWFDSPVFTYLYAELNVKNKSYDVVLSDWDETNSRAIDYTDLESICIVDDVVFSSDKSRLIAYPESTKSRISKYIIPTSVSVIGANAFEACVQLKEIIIPDSVVSIEAEAFSGCFSLKLLNVPLTVANVDSSAFHMVTIDKFHFHASAEFVATDFETSGSLHTITIDEQHPLYVLENGVLFTKDKKQLLRYPPAKVGSHYEIPAGIECIGEMAFSCCTLLSEIIIPDTITTIKRCAFNNTGLVSAHLPESIVQIDEMTFIDCEQLVFVRLPSGISEIPHGMFSNCISLRKFNVPSHILIIGEWAFSGCEFLTEVNMPNSVKEIKNDAFYFCQRLKAIIIPKSVKKIGAEAFQYCRSLEEIEIYGEIKSIGYYTFADCDELKSVKLPDTLKRIGEGAFHLCTSLYSIQLPDSLEIIEAEAFSNCEKLIKIDLPRNVTTIGDNAFEHCGNLNYGFKLGLINRFGERVLSEQED